MDALLVSTSLVAIAEIGDKTQLLALLLAARFQRRGAVLLGVLVATLANHALAAAVGSVAADWLEGPWVRWVLGVAFLAFAGWALIPDRLETATEPPPRRSFTGVFWATAVAFFLVEMGDKTQVATVALGARFQQVLPVAVGTTAGMMLANAPVVWLGKRAMGVLPLRAIRWAAAACFAAVGVWVLLSR